MLPHLRQRSQRCRPRAHQIAHRFMSHVGYPSRRQFAGAMQLRQHQSVTAIGLDPSPTFIGISDGATTTHSCPKPVSSRQSPFPQGPASQQTLRRRRCLPSRATILRRTSGRFSNTPLSAIATQTAVLYSFNPTYGYRSSGPPSRLEALCRQSSATLDVVHDEDGPPITQRTSGLELLYKLTFLLKLHFEIARANSITDWASRL